MKFNGRNSLDSLRYAAAQYLPFETPEYREEVAQWAFDNACSIMHADHHARLSDEPCPCAPCSKARPMFA